MTLQNRVPTADGLASQWTPSAAAAHFGMVDDPVGSPDDDTTYLYTSTINKVEFFTFTAFSFSSTSVTKVSVFLRARTVASGVNLIAGGLRVNGTNYWSSTSNPITTYAEITKDWLTNPDTAASWLEADVEGLGSNPLEQFAFASGGTVAGTMRCTQCYCIADYVLAYTTVVRPPYNKYIRNLITR